MMNYIIISYFIFCIIINHHHLVQLVDHGLQPHLMGENLLPVVTDARVCLRGY